MEISARNQLKGKISKIVRGSVNGEVTVDVGGQTVTSSILGIGDRIVWVCGGMWFT
jgi:molybdopterin-binding protein